VTANAARYLAKQANIQRTEDILKFNLWLDLLRYGVILIGLSLLAHHQATGLMLITLPAGLAGGVLTVLWAILGFLGRDLRSIAIATLCILSTALLLDSVRALQAVREGNSTVTSVAMILAVLIVFSVGQVVNLWKQKANSPPQSAGNVDPQATARSCDDSDKSA
jgi:hypothetical protein